MKLTLTSFDSLDKLPLARAISCMPHLGPPTQDPTMPDPTPTSFWTHYISDALRTESIQMDLPATVRRDRRILHACVGLTTELIELEAWLDGGWTNAEYAEIAALSSRLSPATPDRLAKARSQLAVEEIGDMIWYMALLIDALDLPTLEIFAPRATRASLSRSEDPMRNLKLVVGEIVDGLGKRHVFYGKVLDRQALIDQLSALAYGLARVARLAHSTLVHAASLNRSKLKARYPEHFTSEAALQRDRGAEHAALGDP